MRILHSDVKTALLQEVLLCATMYSPAVADDATALNNCGDDSTKKPGEWLKCP